MTDAPTLNRYLRHADVAGLIQTKLGALTAKVDDAREGLGNAMQTSSEAKAMASDLIEWTAQISALRVVLRHLDFCEPFDLTTAANNHPALVRRDGAAVAVA